MCQSNRAKLNPPETAPRPLDEWQSASIAVRGHASDTFFVCRERLERGAAPFSKRQRRKKRGRSSEEDLYNEILENTLDS